MLAAAAGRYLLADVDGTLSLAAAVISHPAAIPLGKRSARRLRDGVKPRRQLCVREAWRLALYSRGGAGVLQLKHSVIAEMLIAGKCALDGKERSPAISTLVEADEGADDGLIAAKLAHKALLRGDVPILFGPAWQKTMSAEMPPKTRSADEGEEKHGDELVTQQRDGNHPTHPWRRDHLVLHLERG